MFKPHLQHEPMKEQNQQKQKVVDCITIFFLDPQNPRSPEWIVQLFNVGPGVEAELEHVFCQYHHLREKM